MRLVNSYRFDLLLYALGFLPHVRLDSTYGTHGIVFILNLLSMFFTIPRKRYFLMSLELSKPTKLNLNNKAAVAEAVKTHLEDDKKNRMENSGFVFVVEIQMQ